MPNIAHESQLRLTPRSGSAEVAGSAVNSMRHVRHVHKI